MTPATVTTTIPIDGINARIIKQKFRGEDVVLKNNHKTKTYTVEFAGITINSGSRAVDRNFFFRTLSTMEETGFVSMTSHGTTLFTKRDA